MNPTKAAPHTANNGIIAVNNSTIIVIKAVTNIENANIIDVTIKLIIKYHSF